ncbi:unnamed protein product, partial [Staurois parvus]
SKNSTHQQCEEDLKVGTWQSVAMETAVQWEAVQGPMRDSGTWQQHEAVYRGPMAD